MAARVRGYRIIPDREVRAARHAIAAEGQLLDAGLGLLQQAVAVLAQGFAALINGDAFLELDVAALQAADDGFQFLQSALEAAAP